MATTLTAIVNATMRADASTFSITPVTQSLTVNDLFMADRVTVTEASAVTLELGAVTTPRYGYFHNADDTNYLEVRNDAAVLAKLKAGEACFIPLGSTVTLKAQADTADCEMDYALWEDA